MPTTRVSECLYCRHLEPHDHDRNGKRIPLDAPMPTPLTVDCGCAFHPKLGEAGESLLVLTYCPTHAAAPQATALVRSAFELGFYGNDGLAKGGQTEKMIDAWMDDARALLATLDQTGG